MLRTLNPKDTHSKYFFFIIVIILTEAKLNFTQEKNAFAHAMKSSLRIFLYFNYTKKIQTFPKKFLTVVLINRTEKW